MIDKYNQCTCNIAGMLVFCCIFLDEKNVIFIAESGDVVWGRDFTRQ